MTWAWEQPLKLGPKLVLIALADHSDGSGVCWPGHDLIAEKCGMSRSTVVEHIKLLEAEGLVRAERTRSGSRSGFTRYFLALDKAVHKPVEKAPVNVGIPDVQNLDVQNLDVQSSPSSMSELPSSIKEEPKAIEPKTPPIAPQGGQSEIELEPSSGGELKRDAIEAWFEAVLWPAYPKRVDKQQALAELVRLKPSQSLLDEILAGVELRKRAERHAQSRREFFSEWKALHRWLRKRCWTDHYDVSRETGGAPRCHCGKMGVVGDGRRWFCRAHDPDYRPTT